MSIKAIVTTLILGSSSVVLAQPMAREHREPQRSFTHRDFGGRPGAVRERQQPRERFDRPVVRDHERYERQRYERPVYRDRDDDDRWERFERPIYRDRWFQPSYGYYYQQPSVYITPPVYTAPMTPFINGAMSISLGGVAGTGIELSASGGATYVQQVVITYTDGRTQVLQVGQELDAGNPVLDLGTDGSPVASVTVYGSGSGVSAVAI